jgi:hypothetical protein
MPLRDHFHSPLNDTHSWDEIHGQWPGELVRQLAKLLPQGYRAAPKIQLGSALEFPIATSVDVSVNDAVTATLAPQLATLAPTRTIDADLSEQDEYEVRIYDTARNRQLVAVIELISPSNKDRPDSRELFLCKIASLLQQGVCVSLVDLVTTRHANLYDELTAKLERSSIDVGTASPNLYAVTLRKRPATKRRPRVDVWFHEMTLDEPLPTIPIWLAPDRRVMLALETSYAETCGILGIA